MASERIDPDLTYSSAEVARLVFGHKVEWLYKNKPRLQRYDKFPGPIASVGNPRYSGAALLDWLHREANGPRAERLKTIVSGGTGTDVGEILKERREKPGDS